MADKLDLPQVRGFKMVSLNIASLPLHIDEFRTWLDMYNKNIDLIALNVGVVYSGEYDVCDVTLSVYPNRASLKNMPGHGGNRTYDLWNTSPI
jgi:hypothetical protein